MEGNFTVIEIYFYLKNPVSGLAKDDFGNYFWFRKISSKNIFSTQMDIVEKEIKEKESVKISEKESGKISEKESEKESDEESDISLEDVCIPCEYEIEIKYALFPMNSHQVQVCKDAFIKMKEFWEDQHTSIDFFREFRHEIDLDSMFSGESIIIDSEQLKYSSTDEFF